MQACLGLIYRYFIQMDICSASKNCVCSSEVLYSTKDVPIVSLVCELIDAGMDEEKQEFTSDEMP